MGCWRDAPFFFFPPRGGQGLLAWHGVTGLWATAKPDAICLFFFFNSEVARAQLAGFVGALGEVLQFPVPFWVFLPLVFKPLAARVKGALFPASPVFLRLLLLSPFPLPFFHTHSRNSLPILGICVTQVFGCLGVFA